jgi:hypothetical protein
MENGDFYSGNWLNGTREGYGRYDWANGAFYVGGFKFNGLHGKGAFHTATKEIYTGIFEDNIFIGEDTADLNKTKILSVDEKFWQSYILADENAKAINKSKATTVEFATLASKVIEDFPNDFIAYRGEPKPLLINRSGGWYSSLTTNNLIYASIFPPTLTHEASFYAFLFVGTDSLVARNEYEKLVSTFKGSKLACCNLVADTYEFTGPIYSSSTTSWLTLNTNAGYDETLYAGMVVEIELSTGLANNSWNITFRVYHMSQ